MLVFCWKWQQQPCREYGGPSWRREAVRMVRRCEFEIPAVIQVTSVVFVPSGVRRGSRWTSRIPARHAPRQVLGNYLTAVAVNTNTTVITSICLVLRGDALIFWSSITLHTREPHSFNQRRVFHWKLTTTVINYFISEVILRRILHNTVNWCNIHLYVFNVLF
jgi:hypothetical protein